MQSGQTVRRSNVRIRNDGSSREIDLEVVPVTPPARRTVASSSCFSSSNKSHRHPHPAAPAEARAPGRDELSQLRQELDATKEYLQSMIEQQDAANEELRSANEEILSSNEELQSTNEELQTAKEELQSSNEELSTVNEQLQQRNLELTQSNNDLVNLFASTNIPVVMVGSDLRIRRVTLPAKPGSELAADGCRTANRRHQAADQCDLDLVNNDPRGRRKWSAAR